MRRFYVFLIISVFTNASSPSNATSPTIVPTNLPVTTTCNKPLDKVLQIDCKKNKLSGTECSNYIGQYIQALCGFTQNNGITGDLPNFGYSSGIIPQDTDEYGCPVLYSSIINETEYKYTSLNVGLSIQINNIVGIDAVAGTMRMDVVLILTWVDPRLSWNLSLTDWVSDGIITDDADLVTDRSQPPTLIPTNMIWTPDLNLVNGNQPFSSMFVWSPAAQLYSSGRLFLYGTGSITANCKLHLAKFPFDTQNCPFIFASGSNVIAMGYNLSWFQSSPQYETDAFKPSIGWKLKGFYELYLTSYLVSQFGGPENTLQLSSTLFFFTSLKRYDYYYLITGIVPCIALAGMSIIALWVPDPVTQIAMMVTIILALVALQWSVSGFLPISEAPTFMDTLNLICLFFVFSTTVVACFVFYLSSLHSNFPDICLCWFRLFFCIVPKNSRQYMKVSPLHEGEVLVPFNHDNENNNDGENHTTKSNQYLLQGQNNFNSNTIDLENSKFKESKTSIMKEKHAKYELEYYSEEDEINHMKWKQLAKLILNMAKYIVIISFPIAVLVTASEYGVI